MSNQRTPWNWIGQRLTAADGDWVLHADEREEWRVSDADAEFIVRACNAHDELVGVLRDVASTPSAIIDSRAASQLLRRLKLAAIDELVS